MRSTLCSFNAATTSRSCASRSLPLDGITSAFRPRSRAVSMPGASERFEITIAMRALGMRPASMLSAMATKLETNPRTAAGAAESRRPRISPSGGACAAVLYHEVLDQTAGERRSPAAFPRVTLRRAPEARRISIERTGKGSRSILVRRRARLSAEPPSHRDPLMAARVSRSVSRFLIVSRLS